MGMQEATKYLLVTSLASCPNTAPDKLLSPLLRLQHSTTKKAAMSVAQDPGMSRPYTLPVLQTCSHLRFPAYNAAMSHEITPQQRSHHSMEQRAC